MRTSILQVVTTDMAAVVTDLDEDAVAGMTAAAERLTLLSWPSRVAKSQRYHPLVREFLEARLRAAYRACWNGRVASSGRARRGARLAGRRIPLSRGRRIRLRGNDDRRSHPRDHGCRPTCRSDRGDRPGARVVAPARPRPRRLADQAPAPRLRLSHRTLGPSSKPSNRTRRTTSLLNLITLYMQSGLGDARAATSLCRVDE